MANEIKQVKIDSTNYDIIAKQATQDGNGNVITDTYVTKTDIGDTTALETKNKEIVGAMNELYSSIYTIKDPVDSLENTTWRLHDEPNLFSSGTAYNVNFMSAGNNYSTIQVVQESVTMLKYDTTSIYYKQNYSAQQPIWYNEDYKTITFTDGDDIANMELIAWLQQNATMVSGPKISLIDNLSNTIFGDPNESTITTWLLKTLPSFSSPSAFSTITVDFQYTDGDEKKNASSIRMGGSSYYQLCYDSTPVANFVYANGRYEFSSWIKSQYATIELQDTPNWQVTSFLEQCNAIQVPTPPITLKTDNKTIIGAINEINTNTVDKIKELDFWASDVTNLSPNGVDGITWNEVAFITHENGSTTEVATSQHRVPIMAGDGITLDVDPNNPVIRINAIANDSSVAIQHDTYSNWQNNSTIIEAGQIIIYDPDSTCESYRLKIGDGSKRAAALPFYSGDITQLYTANKELVPAINELFTKLYHQNENIISLQNTTWVLNDVPSMQAAYTTYNVNITSAGMNFSTIKFVQYSGIGLNYDNTTVHTGYQGAKVLPQYKQLTFINGDDIANGELIKWMQENAICIKGSGSILITDDLTDQIFGEENDGSNFGTWQLQNLPSFSTSGLTTSTSSFMSNGIIVSTIKFSYMPQYSKYCLCYNDTPIAKYTYISGGYGFEQWIDKSYATIQLLEAPNDAMQNFLNNCNAIQVSVKVSLETTNKKIVNAINEINAKTQKLDEIDVDAILDIQDTLYFNTSDIIKNLSNTTWLFNDNISLYDYNEGKIFNFNFTSGGITYTQMSIHDAGNNYATVLYYDDTNVCSRTASNPIPSWTNASYKTITILNGEGTTNEDLISFIRANATLISGNSTTKMERTIPVFTSANEGQILSIVNGVPTWINASINTEMAAAEDNLF